MKKTKIGQRINNAVNAFFDDEPETFGENGLTCAPDSALLRSETSAQFNEKGDRLVKMLKRAFLFLPGALYLFFGTLSILTFDFLWNPLTVLVVFLIGGFLTVFGLGNLKNPKHLAIPLSIVAVGIMTFALFSAVGNLRYVFEYGIYFFPLALIAPFLAKKLVDDRK
jgi:hypothetical protein